MKISILLLFAVIFSVSAKSYAQEARVTFNLKNVSVNDVFNTIRSQTSYSFWYDLKDVDASRIVSVKADDQKVNEVLNNLFKDEDVNVRMVDNHIVLKSSNSSYSPPIAQQNTRKITGVVSDAMGPIIGANIIEKGTTNGTTTDMDGKYSLEVPENAILQITYIGYVEQNIAVKSQNVINIQLREDTQALEEVVVVGYGTQKKESLTGAISTIKSKELLKVPTASISQNLPGKLPGLVFKETTGKPGSSPKISIRGFGDALVIVDGIEQENYQNIDPNEIATFTMLKDASAAIYGSRAGNGVILITTNRGAKGKTKVSLSSSISGQTPTIRPEFVDSWDYAIIQNEAKAWSGQKPMFTDEEIQKFRDGTDPNYSNTDHYSEIIKKWSLMENVNLNVSGGGEKVNYFVSMGLMNQDGIYKSDDVNFKRYNIRSNIDAKLNDYLSLSFDLSTRITDSNDVPFGDYDIFQTIGTTTNRFPAYYPDQTKIPFVGRNSHSALAKTNRDISGYDDTDRDYTTAAISLKYMIPFIKGLNLQAKGFYIGDKTNKKKWTKPYNTYNYDKENDEYSIAATGGKYSLTQRSDRAQKITFQGMAEYENTFKNHYVKGLFVTEMINERSNWFNGYREGFISDAVDEMFAGSSTNMNADGSAKEEARMSFVGRVNYAYKSKYLLEATARYDGSSRFAKEQRWGFFPSVQAAWRISEEYFIKDKFQNIDNMKLRLTYSHTGYDRNADAYQYLSSYTFKSQYAFGDNMYTSIRSNGLANYNISWEDIHLYNVGYDLDLWKGLLGLEVDAFYRLRTNVLGTRSSSLPNTIGVTLPQQNLNSVDNRGFEITLKHQNQIGNFNYSISPNISWSRSKYVKFDEQEYTDPDEDRIKRKTGKWTDVVYGYKTDGMFQNTDEIKNSDIDYDNKGNSTLKPGMVKYVDTNGDKKIDWRDQVDLGKGDTPKMMYGLSLNCNYKNFDLSMLFQGAADFNIGFTDHMQHLTINHVWNSYKYLYDNRWTPENPNAMFPGTTNGTNWYNTKQSDLWYKSAAYCRLKNLTLGYTIPSKLTQKAGINRVRFYFSGYNLLTFDKLSDYQQDPEAGSSLMYPLYKSIAFGFNVEL
jgi:TonB-linked SusC/RagA family outer membrane protein